MAPLYFVLESFYWGYLLIFALIVLVRSYKVFNIQTDALIEANNYLLVIRVILTLITTAIGIAELFLSWYSGVEYEQYAILNRWAGPYALFQWIPFLLITLPPFIMFRKLNRKSFKATIVIVVLWSLSLTLTKALEMTMDIQWIMTVKPDYFLFFGKIVLYNVLLIPAYLTHRKQ
ncbi:hypothetical protein [Desertivirga arenae]|uniref:hypothetical protein n=1 Tax=Desertivirga arenae TaxID=2810309 RepID=UPI001A96C90D|nr:hypothetical protein [Pedobacter sp. SYSU D00823]